MDNTIITVFNLATMDTQKYSQSIRDLEAAGQGKPKGRLHHVAARQEDGSIVVTDIWESAASLEGFGKLFISGFTESRSDALRTEDVSSPQCD